MLARVQTALYRGNGDAAWRHLVEQERRLNGSMLLHVQALRVETLYLRARSALAIAAAAAAPSSVRRRFLSIARAYTKRIARERMPWSDPLARLVDAGIASVAGRHEDALSDLLAAEDGFERADMGMYLAISRRRRAQLAGGEVGRVAERKSDDWMTGQGIRNPVAFARMLAPGFPDQ